MNLDLIAAAVCGWIALCIFGLHAFSDPKRRQWITLPEYVRWGLLVAGIPFTWRSVNFATQPGVEASPMGHINAEGLVAACALAYLVTTLMVWAWRSHMAAKARDKLDWAEPIVHADPDVALVPMTPAELVEHARAKGFYVNGGLPKQP
jgi:hypothetical protein